MNSNPNTPSERSLSDGWGGPYAVAPYATTRLPPYVEGLAVRPNDWRHPNRHLLTEATLDAATHILDVVYLPGLPETVEQFGCPPLLVVLVSPDDPGQPNVTYILRADETYITPTGNIVCSTRCGYHPGTPTGRSYLVH